MNILSLRQMGMKFCLALFVLSVLPGCPPYRSSRVVVGDDVKTKEIIYRNGKPHRFVKYYDLADLSCRLSVDSSSRIEVFTTDGKKYQSSELTGFSENDTSFHVRGASSQNLKLKHVEMIVIYKKVSTVSRRNGFFGYTLGIPLAVGLMQLSPPATDPERDFQWNPVLVGTAIGAGVGSIFLINTYEVDERIIIGDIR